MNVQLPEDNEFFSKAEFDAIGWTDPLRPFHAVWKTLGLIAVCVVLTASLFFTLALSVPRL